MSIQVGIDVTSLTYGRGVSRYTANLVRALLTYAPVSLSLYGSSFRGKKHLEQEISQILNSVPSKNWPTKIALQNYPPSLQNLLWNLLKKNQIKKLLPKIEVFHSWDWLQPPDQKLPVVSTIHDLAILRFPDTAHPQILSMHHASWKRLKAQKAHLIAISRATKKDIIELLEYPAELIHVIYEALPLEFEQVSQTMTEAKETSIKQKFALDNPFILFAGTREPRKNLLRLIEAWEPFANDFQLVIAGDVGWDKTDELSKKAHHSQLKFLGRVTDQELAVLYGEAELFAYPSLYEGFGLPILEAFYYGTPVLTSNISSMVEVAGNAAELVDPLSVASIRQGLKTILDEKLLDQQKRLQRMIIRLQMFDWQRVALETLKVYQKALDDQK